MVKKTEQVSKASKGLIEGFYNSSKFIDKTTKNLAVGIMPHFDRKKALESVRKDPTVMASLSTLVDKSMANGYKLKGKHGKSNVEDFRRKTYELRFDKVLRQVFFNAYGYGNVFIENVKDDNSKIKELHVLETTETEPIADQHGTVEGYIQVIPGMDDKNNAPYWKPEQITHIAITKLTTGIWGELDIEAIYTQVLIKEYIYAYLGWLYGTNQFKGFYNIKNGNDEQVEEFLSYLRRAEGDITKPLIARGEIEHNILRDFTEGDSVLNLLNKCDANILMLLQVPPITVGLPGDSNRSNSDAQERSLSTRVKSIQKVVGEALNYDLFPKIGYDKIELVFNSPDEKDITKILEEAERMKTIGFKIEIIEKYLEHEGFPIEGKLIDKEMYKAESTGKTDDMFDSRKGKLEGTSNEKIGSGEDGSTRKDQLVSKGTTSFSMLEKSGTFDGLIPILKNNDDDGTEGKYNKYPYTMR